MQSLIQNHRRHDIVFHANGRIDISAHIAKKLSLRQGDIIDIAQHRGEWLMYVKLRAGEYVGRYEGAVYQATPKYNGGTFRTWCRPLCRKVLEIAGCQDILRCPCGEIFREDNTTYVTIIYRCAL